MRRLHALPMFLLVGALMAAPALRAQSDPAVRPAFDVASVRPNTSGESGLRFEVQPGGRFVAINIPLKQLIRAAYTLQLYQVIGAPGWVDSERFDIHAITDRNINVATPWNPGGTFSLLQLMLQSLVAERFQMVVHTETRESPVYVLVVHRPDRRLGEQLRTAESECGSNCGMRAGPGTLTVRRVPMLQVAEFLSQRTGRLVTDGTGLAGNFDFDLRWSPEEQREATGLPSIFTALQEQLGLRLDPGRGPVPVLVIDSIQRLTPD